MTSQRAVGWLALAMFLASIPFANWWLTVHGLAHYPLIGTVPSAVWIIGVAFVLRDLGQLGAGRRWAWAAIVAGVVISYVVADARVATASAVAFAWSESTDALIFTPLANRGTRAFILGVSISGYAASVVDSVLFVRIAFGSYAGWWQLTVAKILFVMAATPIAWAIRQTALAPRPAVV